MQPGHRGARAKLLPKRLPGGEDARQLYLGYVSPKIGGAILSLFRYPPAQECLDYYSDNREDTERTMAEVLPNCPYLDACFDFKCDWIWETLMATIQVGLLVNGENNDHLENQTWGGHK